jgi:uncharacterized membrane protein
MIGPAVGQQQTLQVWQGQYPPPEAVERYEKLLPGALNRMMTMAEKLQAAQIDQSKHSLTYLQNDTRRAHWLGFAIALAAIGGAIWCVALDQPWVAGLLVGVPVMAVARALIESSKKETPSQVIQAAAHVPKTPQPDRKDGTA